MRRFYLIAAILGGVIPYLFFFEFFTSYGVHPLGFMKGTVSNGAAAGFTADILISSVVFWVFMFRQHAAGKGPKPQLFMILNLGIGLSCALPAYLYQREKEKLS